MSENNNIIPLSTGSIENVQLEVFEALVGARKHEEACHELLRTLQRLKQGAGFAGHPNTEEAWLELCGRLAASITALLADPGFHLMDGGFDLFAVEHATLHAVFAASSDGNADHLARQFGTLDPEDPVKLNCTGDQNVLKLLLTYSLDSAYELDFESLFRAAPRRTLPAFLGMLAHRIVFSETAHRRRQRLLELGPLFEQVDVDDGMLNALFYGWMYCSYAQGEHKHDIKRSFNKMMRRSIESKIKLPELTAQRHLKQRPTILVPIEWFTSQHAVYRVLAPSIRQLRNKFKLVMIGRETEMDEVSKDLFDEVIEIKGLVNPSLADLVGHVERVRPDVIYYPSLGMTPWWVALCTVRLAPIQCHTIGHTATSNSPAVDYAILPELCPGDPSLFSETVVLTRRMASMVMRDDGLFPEPKIRRSPDALHIGVSSMACKVNAAFLAICRNLLRRSRRPLKFHFFPSVMGLAWFQAARELRKWLPGCAVVHGSYHYGAYLRAFSACDIHLSTFPFGGMNSNIDSMRLGIPMVTLEGREVHSQCDAGMLRAIGMPESLIAHDVAAFEEAALRIIEDDGERCALAEKLIGTNVDAVFMNQTDDEGSADVLEAMWWLYSNHERIQASKRRYWTVNQRLETL